MSSLLFLAGCYVQSDRDAGRAPTVARPMPTATQPKRAFELIFYAREKRRKDPDGSLRMLEDGVARFGETPEIHSEMAMVVDEKMFKVGKGSPVYGQLARQKLQHIEKAMELIKAGRKWEYDPLRTKTPNLHVRIEQARRAAVPQGPPVRTAGGQLPDGRFPTGNTRGGAPRALPAPPLYRPPRRSPGDVHAETRATSPPTRARARRSAFPAPYS